MPLPYIIELTSKSEGEIKGSSSMYGKNDVILAYSFEHRVYVPGDQAGPGDVSLRFHDPLILCKEIDRSSPILYQHLVSGGLFVEVILSFYKADAQGVEVNYHTIVLNDAIITDISSETKMAFLAENEPFRDMEYVSFSYKSIRWIDESGLTETSDSAPLLHDSMEESELIFSGVLASDMEDREAFNLMFVNHDTMEVVSGVKAQIACPDGSSQHVLSSQNGCFSMQAVDKGHYSLSGFNARPPSAWLGNSYSLVKINQPNASDFGKINPSRRKGKQARHHSAFKHLCKIKEHQVTKGELFSGVAKSHGFSFEELAFFNWGTKQRQKIPEQLKLRFECGELSPAGDEYFLNKGTIYIPESVEKSGLSVNVQHVAFLKQPGQRDVKAKVLTSTHDPIPNVEATLTLGDESTVTAISDEDGVALFAGISSDLAGYISYEDEGDLIAKSLAANIQAAIQGGDMESLLSLMQSAVDFKTVGAAYKANYKGELSEDIRGAFDSGVQKDVVDFLLVKTGLADDGMITFYEETQQA
ncbi:type VI secretion system tube protein TssD [Desulfoluna sp.]|uniref:type VI secretion system tube protein TssD n=1 Tax=Desulfoluna sp. TaxID=2045199 RepID=UPI00262261DF|nr:type VI secretion system tube protein TssD [Desulfoluna sp.]